VALASRLVIFHIVTMLDPVVELMLPVPTNNRSVVPSKNENSGEHTLSGFVPALILMFPFTAGVVLITPFAAKDMAYKAGFAFDPACVPHA